MGMTMGQMLDNMSSVELSHRLALDVIRRKERERAERIRKVNRGR